MATPSPRAWGMAYTGAKVRIPGHKHEMVFDLAGMRAAGSSVPLLANHENKTQSRLGMVGVEITAGGVRLEGSITSTLPDAANIVSQAIAGDAWQLSVGLDIDEMETVAKGESRKINGKSFDGPFLHVKRSVLKEISVVPMGADSETFMRIAAADGASMLFVPIDVKAAFKGPNGAEAGDPEDDDEGGGEEASKGQGKPAEGGALQKMKTLIQHLFEACMSLVDAQSPPAPVQEEETDPMATPNPNAKKPVEQPAQAAAGSTVTAEGGAEIKAMQVALASAQAEILALKAKTDEREKSDGLAKACAEATTKLTAGGFPLTDEVRAQLAVFAAAGPEVLAAFVATYEKVAVKDPPKSQAGATAQTEGSPEVDAALAKLGKQSPEVLAKARDLCAAGLAYKTATGSDVKLDQYVRCNLAEQGVKLA